MALTVTPLTSIGMFLLHIDYVAAAGTQVSATIYRGESATGPWEEIREVDLLAQEAYAYDNTAPMDTPLWYRTVADDGTEFIDGPEEIVTADGGAWLRDPGRPWADIELYFCDAPDAKCSPPDVLSWVGFGSLGRATDATLLEILNAENPSDTYARRKGIATEINFFSRTLDMKTRVYELFTAGGPLFLQLYPEYGWADAFIQTTGDLAEEYITRDQRKPWRRWSAPVRVVDRPVGPIQGAPCANWCALEDAFATFADLTAAPGDWGDVADGSVICP